MSLSHTELWLVLKINKQNQKQIYRNLNKMQLNLWISSAPQVKYKSVNPQCPTIKKLFWSNVKDTRNMR